MASGPPNVPKSCMTPSCHRNARHSAPRPKQAMGSGIAFVADSHDLAAAIDAGRCALISTQGSQVLDLAVFPTDSAQLVYAGQGVDLTVFRTADDLPMRVNPAGSLQLSAPGSAPKSVTTPFCHSNAWNTNGTVPPSLRRHQSCWSG